MLREMIIILTLLAAPSGKHITWAPWLNIRFYTEKDAYKCNQNSIAEKIAPYIYTKYCITCIIKQQHLILLYVR